jgi:hypothetical protein
MRHARPPPRVAIEYHLRKDTLAGRWLARRHISIPTTPACRRPDFG